MTEDLLSKLSAARSDEDREWLVMQFSLDALAPEVREVVWAAAIPHWFDVSFLAVLLDKSEAEISLLFQQLLTLSFIEPFQDRGYNVHERSRSLLLRQLWQNDQPRYRQLSQRAADYCGDQDQSDTGWRIERIYHLLIADPEEGVADFIDTGLDWHDPPNNAYAKVEAMALMAREHADAGRLLPRSLGWTLYWEGTLDFDYSRFLSAKSKFLQIKITPAEDILLAAEVALSLGDVLSFLSEYDQARERYESAILLYREMNSQQGEANCIKGLGDIHGDLGEYDQARERYESALALYQQMSDRQGEANCIQGLGDIHQDLGEYDQARERYNSAMLLYREMSSLHGEANCLYSLGDIHQVLGEYDQARERYESALALYQQIGSRQGEANCIQRLGDIHRNLGEYDQARERYESALALYQQTSDRQGEANCIKGLGDIHLNFGENDQARERYESALPLYQQTSSRQGEANCIRGLGYIHRNLGEYGLALADFNRAIELNDEDTSAIADRGVIYRLMERYEEALADYQRAVSLDANDTSSILGLVACYRKLGIEAEFQEKIGALRELIAKETIYNRACFASICDETDEALKLLRSALEEGKENIAWARKDPDFDWIRDDPRFRQLLDEMAER